MKSSSTVANAGRRPRGNLWMKKDKIQTYLFVLLAVGPCFCGYLLFTLYPNLMSVYYSFLNWNGISKPVFVGFENFTRLFSDYFFWRALSHNLLLMLTIPATITIFSLLIAHLLINKNYPEARLYKVLFFFPNVLAIVVVTLLWAFVYDGSYGLLNGVLKLIGIDNGDYYWLGSKKTALWCLVPPAVWGGVGVYVIIFMNAMRGLPQSIYEAARLEGASPISMFYRITIPLIMPVVRIGILFLVLAELKGFELILILTNGGPSGSTDVIGLYMFNLAFGTEGHNYGYASAIGMLLFVILLTAKILIDKFVPNEAYEY